MERAFQLLKPVMTAQRQINPVVPEAADATPELSDFHILTFSLTSSIALTILSQVYLFFSSHIP